MVVKDDGKQKEQAKEAWHLLNDFVGALTTATGTIHNAALNRGRYKGKMPYPEEDPFSHIQRMAFHYIIIYLVKWTELYKRYRKVIPAEYVKKFQQIVGDIEQRGVIKYRNKCVGHILNNDTGRPIWGIEEEKMIKEIVGADSEKFLTWINAGSSKMQTQSLVYLAKETRDMIAEKWDLKPLKEN